MSALKAALVLGQLSAPFPLSPESVSGGGGVIKGTSVITSRLFLLSSHSGFQLPALTPDESHDGKHLHLGANIYILFLFSLQVMDSNAL